MSKRYSKDNIDYLYDYGIDIQNRTLYIGSTTYSWEDVETGTDFSMAERVIKGLHILDKSDADITVVMNNPGGEWYHGMAIYDALRSAKSNIIMNVYGMAMSMGSVILQAADIRLLAPNSTLLLHYGTDGYIGHSKDFVKAAEENKRINKIMEDIYLENINVKHPNFTLDELEKRIKYDYFIPAREAVKLGLADGILGEEDND